VDASFTILRIMVLDETETIPFLSATANSNACDVDAIFRQPLGLPEGEPLWPVRPDQMPEIVNTVEEFLDAMLFQTHIDRIVVLPNGINLMRQDLGIPEELCHAVRCSSSVREFLKVLSSSQEDTYRARLWHYSVHGVESEVKSDKRSKLLKQKIAALKQQESEQKVAKDAPLYVSELRLAEKANHPIVHDELVKTATQCDVYDFTSLARQMPLWERSEGGIFIGERGTGSGLHIDQCMWSNVGRNWCGFKYLAIWPWEERFEIVEKYGKGKMFHLPLSEEEIQGLQRAKTIALMRPGDCCVFSGAQPHTALCVGDALNISAYESFVPANADAVGVLVRSNIKDMHPKKFWMDDEDLDELYEDVVDNLQRALRNPTLESRLRSRLEECSRRMREKGDAYCKELWRQEDMQERRRRREDDHSSESSAYSDRRSDDGAKQSEAEKSTASSLNEGSSEDETGHKSKKVRSSTEPLLVD